MERSYRDSLKLYEYLAGVETDLQKWTAEMWAQLWGWVREGKTLMAPKELDFCRSTDDIKCWDEVKILHNAGVLPLMSFEYFFKGEYVNRTPFGKSFKHVRQDKCTIRYVEAIEKVVQ